MKQALADLLTFDRILTVLLTANALILGYFHAQFPEYVNVVSAALAGITIFVSVSMSIAKVFANAAVQKTMVEYGAKTAPRG